MSFLNSLAAWQWALLLAVPAAIVALYFLKLRRQPLEVLTGDHALRHPMQTHEQDERSFHAGLLCERWAARDFCGSGSHHARLISHAGLPT